jgi:hypothetical protein
MVLALARSQTTVLSSLKKFQPFDFMIDFTSVWPVAHCLCPMQLVLTLGGKARALGPSADQGEDSKSTLGPLVVHNAQEVSN